VAKFFDDDIFLDARRAKKDFHKIISRDKATKWEKNSESLVNKILTSKIDGNKIFNEILKAKPQDFSDLKNFYLERTGDAGINAWNNLKGQIFQQALDKATSGAQRGAKTGEAVPIFNGRQFENVFKPLKTSRATLEKGNSDNKFTSIFSKAEQELIGDIIEITKLRKPNPSNPQGSGPSGFALNRAVKGLINSAIDKAPVSGSYVEKRQVNKAIDIEKKAESDFANPEPITKNQKKYINRERRN